MNKYFHWLFASFIGLFLAHFIFFVFYITHHTNTMQKNYQDNMAQEVMNVVHMIQATPLEQLPRAIRTIESAHVDVALSERPTFSIQVMNPSFWRMRQLIEDNARELKLSVKISASQWINIIAHVEQSQSIWPHVFMLMAELLIAAIVLFYAWSINRFILPLKDFQNVAKGLGINLHTTVLKEYKGPHIIQETAEAMNKMQQRIKDLIRDRTLMLAAISHDLKTPITRLKLRAHLFENLELRQDVLYDLDEMETMISELLIFSKNENETEDRQKFDLNSFIETLCHELSDMNLKVSYQRLDKRVPFSGRKIALKRAFNNIIQNAVKYGIQAEVTLKETNEAIYIYVDDQGGGIDESEFEKVFAPFYRLDFSRSRKIAGTGLGLAISRSAVRSHGGDITLSNLKAGGLRVTFTFNKKALT